MRISAEISLKRLFGGGQDGVALVAPAQVLRHLAGHIGRKPSFEIITDQSDCSAAVHFPTPGLVKNVEQKPDHSDSTPTSVELAENTIFRED